MEPKRARERRLRLIIAGLVLAGAGAIYLSIRGPKLDQEADPYSSSSTAGGLQEPTKLNRPDSGSRQEVRLRDPEEWLAEILARHPDLTPVWRNVPDEENGFLQWLEFSEKYQLNGRHGSASLPLTGRLADMIAGNTGWDAEIAKTFLAENGDLLEEIARIGLLPDESAAGIPFKRWSFPASGLPKQCARLLLADAQIAAEGGDGNRALQRVQAALGLARHFQNIEAPDLMMSAMAASLRKDVQARAIEDLLPSLELSPATAALWREAFRPREPDFAPILKADGWVNLQRGVIPALNGDLPGQSQVILPDPDAFVDAYARDYVIAARYAEEASVDELLGLKGEQPWFPPTDSHDLSAESLNILEAARTGSKEVSRVWAMESVIAARIDAALALLAGQEMPLEPFTQLPFVHDAESGTLHVPDDPRLREHLRIDAPLKLP